jgi:DNA-binding transcriptional MerR regulator
MYPKYLSIKQTARILGVTPLTLRNWDKAGKFVPSRHPINNYRVYKIELVEKLLKDIEESKGIKMNKDKVKKLVVQHLSD